VWWVCPEPLKTDNSNSLTLSFYINLSCRGCGKQITEAMKKYFVLSVFIMLIGAFTNLDSKAFVGQHSLIISGKVDSIGESAIIGAGAVVTKSVDSGVVVAGNPAKRIR
jgi:hypothetical protein